MEFLAIGGAFLLLFLLGRRRPSIGIPISANVPQPPPRPGSTVVVRTGPAILEPEGGYGTITPPDEEAIPSRYDPSSFDFDQSIPADILAVVQQGGTANEEELATARNRATALGMTDLAAYFQRRIDRRRAYQRQQHESGPGRPMAPAVAPQSVQTEALPTARASRAELMRLATRLADSIRRAPPRGYDRALLVRFQQAAGLVPDGDYGRKSAQALGYYGRLPAGQVPAPQY